MTADKFAAPPEEEVGFAPDSPVGGTGFEPSVPRRAPGVLVFRLSCARYFRWREIKQRRHELVLKPWSRQAGIDGSNPAPSSGGMVWGRRRGNGTIVAAPLTDGRPCIERQPRKKPEPSTERLLGLLHRWRDGVNRWPQYHADCGCLRGRSRRLLVGPLAPSAGHPRICSPGGASLPDRYTDRPKEKRAGGLGHITEICSRSFRDFDGTSISLCACFCTGI